jgi:hypothetical protein
MTTAYTSLLGLALPVTGELSGTWGTVVNDSMTSLVDSAVAGTTTISTDANVTLDATTLASNQARQAVLLFSGARTAQRTITAPALSKLYVVINATTGGYAVKLVGSGPTTGLTIPNGATALVAWNGSDFIEVGASTIGSRTINGALTVTGLFTAGSAMIEKSNAIGASNIDLSLGNYFTKTIAAPTTFTLSNTPSSGTVASFILDLTNGGSSAVTWWANLKWTNGLTPSLTASGRDVLGFFTYNNGTTWNGFVLGKDMK